MDIEKLKALALAAAENSSNWTATGPSYGATLPKYLDEVIALDDDGNEDHRICAGPDWSEEFFDERTANMEYIAAACPAAVLELIADVERLRADAARYHHMRQAQWFKAGFAKTEANASAFHYCGELLDQLVDAAIEANTEAAKERA